MVISVSRGTGTDTWDCERDGCIFSWFLCPHMYFCWVFRLPPFISITCVFLAALKSVDGSDLSTPRRRHPLTTFYFHSVRDPGTRCAECGMMRHVV